MSLGAESSPLILQREEHSKPLKAQALVATAASPSTVEDTVFVEQAALAATLFLVSVVSVGAGFLFLLDRSPSSAWWLLVGLFGYGSTVIRHLWESARLAVLRCLYVQVVIRKDGSPNSHHLIDAVRAALPKDGSGHFEAEATLQYVDDEDASPDDRAVSSYRVELNPWLSAQSQLVTLQVGGRRLQVEVKIERAGDVLVGHPPRPQRVETMTLSCWATGRVEKLALMHRWLQLVYERHTESKPGRIAVYALEEYGGDWMPEWKRLQNIPAPVPRGDGQGPVFVESQWMDDLLTLGDYAKERRTMVAIMLYGAKGSGKTKFVEALAGRLRAPMYHMNLRSSLLTDDRLVQLISRSKIRADFVVLHFDEVQAALSHWSGSEQERQEAGKRAREPVSLEGVEAALDSEVAPRRGIMIFTGSKAVGRIMQRQRAETVGFFRRFHRILEIPPLSQDFGRRIFFAVLGAVLLRPEDPSERAFLESRWEQFESAWFSQCGDSAVDALRKYLDLHICRAHQQRWIVRGGSASCILQQQFRGQFFGQICDAREIRDFIAEYAAGWYRNKSVAKAAEANDEAEIGTAGATGEGRAGGAGDLDQALASGVAGSLEATQQSGAERPETLDEALHRG